MTGMIFNIQRYGVQDGPGIRTVVFLKGCTLKCAWCCNPESQSPFSEIMYYELDCLRCEACLNICPKLAISHTEKEMVIDRSRCDRCWKCIDICPTNSMRRIGEEVSTDQIIAEVTKDEVFYRRSGGGMTLSGGEPTLQWLFAKTLLEKCRGEGIHSALETCGHQEWERFISVACLADLVLYDLKHLNSKKHKEFTGAPNDMILNNFSKLVDLGIHVIVRIPIIVGFNSLLKEIEELLEFIKDFKTIDEIHLLPYHRLGVPKYKRLGREYSLDVKPLNDEEIEAFILLAKSKGFLVRKGG